MALRIPIKTRKELIDTAKNGNVEIFKIIVDSCKPIDDTCIESKIDLSWVLISDKKGRTLLHIASKHGHLDILNFIRKSICEATSDKKLRKQYLDITDFRGRTALFYASAEGHGEVVCYLIDREASLEQITNGDHIAPGSTALMASAEKNNLMCFEYLLDAKASIQAQRRDGADALYLAARHGNHEIIRILSINDHMESIVNRETFHGRTAILTAALHGHLETCKVLHTSGANLNYQDNDRFTALILASNEGHHHVSKWLVVNGADIHRKDKHGGTALDAALAHGFSEIVKFLIQSQDILEYGWNLDQLTKICSLSNEKITQ